jgi:hypothetical protein
VELVRDKNASSHLSVNSGLVTWSSDEHSFDAVRFKTLSMARFTLISTMKILAHSSLPVSGVPYLFGATDGRLAPDQGNQAGDGNVAQTLTSSLGTNGKANLSFGFMVDGAFVYSAKVADVTPAPTSTMAIYRFDRFDTMVHNAPVVIKTCVNGEEKYNTHYADTGDPLNLSSVVLGNVESSVSATSTHVSGLAMGDFVVLIDSSDADIALVEDYLLKKGF